ncbi:MAG TPA: acyl-CoA dehydrogenase family protein [Acidimicrobiales bacterium]|nr:acyl-CoA dehydrogenase family protein [Acidimicrobiales bacterium]
MIADEVAAWLSEHWEPGRPKQEWLEMVVDAGWAVPSWPREWFGRGVTPDDGKVVAQEFRKVGAPGSGQDAHNLWANTLLAYGAEALKQKLIRRLLLDQVSMCLLYSEPGAGSDLAAVATRADRDGDEYIVTGQKVWTSGAAKAEYGMLIARTDWDVPKHKGLSFFFFPMRQDGVEVRPIRQITDEAHFNEVFIDAARVPAENLLGDLNSGWRVLQTALAYERSVMGDVARGPRNPAAKPGSGGPMGDGGVGGAEVDLVGLARATGRWSDPVVRQMVMQVHILRQVNRWNGVRAKAQLQQGTASPVLSLGKLAMSRILHEGAHVQCLILGAEAMLQGAGHVRGDAANFLSLNAYFTSIGGGTDQIQRNIIGERVLGLPKEPEVDRDIPFRDVRRATA